MCVQPILQPRQVYLLWLLKIWLKEKKNTTEAISKYSCWQALWMGKNLAKIYESMLKRRPALETTRRGKQKKKSSPKIFSVNFALGYAVKILPGRPMNAVIDWLLILVFVFVLFVFAWMSQRMDWPTALYNAIDTIEAGSGFDPPNFTFLSCARGRGKKDDVNHQ